MSDPALFNYLGTFITLVIYVAVYTWDFRK
jgi:hypothetical protein